MKFALLLYGDTAAEARAQIGGIYVVDVADRTAALALAKRVPVSPGLVVEVRPLMSFDGDTTGASA